MEIYRWFFRIRWVLFDPRRTLGDGIGESLRNRGMKKADVEKRVAELLEQCGLEKEYAKRYLMR